MKIYVVTKGEYSDYEIMDVFLDKGKADLYAMVHSTDWDICQVEEYDTKDEDINGDPSTIRYVWKIWSNGYDKTKYLHASLWQIIPAGQEVEPIRGTSRNHIGYVMTRERDEDLALKVWYDKEAQNRWEVLESEYNREPPPKDIITTAFGCGILDLWMSKQEDGDEEGQD